MIAELSPEKVLEVYRRRPYSFAIDVLGQQPVTHQRRILESVRDNRRTLVVACNSVGKDWIAGAVTLWWQSMWGEAQTITTAPTGDQVRNIQWREIRAMWANALVPIGGDFPDVMPEWRISPKRHAFGRATNMMEKFSGFHNAHQLIIVTEGTAVADPIFEGIRSLMASGDGRLLVLTNPTRLEGECYEAAHGKREGWNVITISAHETPNLQACAALDVERAGQGLKPHDVPADCPTPYPFLITHEFERECARDFGPDSDYYRVHVNGTWPKASIDTLIALEWIEAAARRTGIDSGAHPVTAGIDVAGPGEDETVLVIREGPHVIAQHWWPEHDPRGEIVAALRPFASRLQVANVDSAGIGYYLGLHLADLGVPVRLVNVGASSEALDEMGDPKFANLKAELYWQLRATFQDGDVNGITDERMKGQLSSMRYHHDSRGRVVIESKADMRKRNVSSPDRAEALMLAFTTPLEPHVERVNYVQDEDRVRIGADI